MRHHGMVSRVVEGQEPTLPAPGFGFRPRPCQGLRRQTLELALVCDAELPGIRGILHIVFETRLDLGQLAPDRLEPGLVVVREIHAGEMEIP